MVKEFEIKVIIEKDECIKTLNLNAYFCKVESQYGNGCYLNILSGNDFEKRYDLRYDKDFKFNKRCMMDYLEDWASDYWSGNNGAWSLCCSMVKAVK